MHTVAEKGSIQLQKVARRPIGRVSVKRGIDSPGMRSKGFLSRQRVKGKLAGLLPSAAEQHPPRKRGVPGSHSARRAGRGAVSVPRRLGGAVTAVARRASLPTLLVVVLSVAAAGGAVSGFQFSAFQLPWNSDSTALSLPDISVANEELLAFSSIETEGQGSGEFSVPESPLISNVGTSTYEVQQGDTLSEIASRHDLDVGTLIGFNGISDVRRVMAGSTLKIPNIDGIPYTVKRGDSLEGIAATYNVPLTNILDANDLQTALIKPGQQLFIPGAEISEYTYRRAMGTLFIYPVKGRMTSGFGYRIDPFTGIRRMHYGLDLAKDVGAPIRATMSGTVAITGNQPRGYGRYVVVKHRYGYQSLYGHLHSIDVRRGQYVEQGQTLGTMGNSGRSTGPHLHFSIYKNNAPINPLDTYLR